MKTRFHNRSEAGKLLAERLLSYADQTDVVILALPRGGVPVAAEVARRLHAPLDVFVVRKLGLPGQKELAMGAIASGGVRVLNAEVFNYLTIPDQLLEEVTVVEQRELERREHDYRRDLPPPDVRGKTVIVVDDGVATGSTMMAAIAALRQMEVARIVVAVPAIAPSTFSEIEVAADEIVAVLVPPAFCGVGQWYEDFSQTTDEEVRSLLAHQDYPATHPSA